MQFDVTAAVPEVKNAKLESPKIDSPLYADTPVKITLRTHDRFGNAVLSGGLPVATRLQIVKQSAHDLTTLVPNNHTIEVEDNNDGTYAITVVLSIAATVKVVVNMDKNLPNSLGELPPLQFAFELPPEAGGEEGEGKPSQDAS